LPAFPFAEFVGQNVNVVMTELNDERWGFIVEYFDPAAELVRQYQLLYYLGDSTVEMYDIKNRRTFLKRTDYPSITLEHLYIGSIVTVFSRNLTVADYADEFTRQRLSKASEKTVVWTTCEHAGVAMAAVYGAGLKVNQMKTVVLSDQQGEELQKPAGVKSVVMEVVGADAVAAWSATVAEQGLPAAGSASSEAAEVEINAVFSSSFPCYAACENCSLCIILPHAIAEGKAGAMLRDLGSKCQINCAQMFILGSANAMEFYEVYKGVRARDPAAQGWLAHVLSVKRLDRAAFNVCCARVLISPPRPGGAGVLQEGGRAHRRPLHRHRGRRRRAPRAPCPRS
jgi:nucleoside-diphosphate kinase